MDFANLTFANTGSPVLIFVVAALLLPMVLIPRRTRSQGRVAMGIVGSALILIAIGPVISVAFDARDLPAGVATAPKGQLALVVYQMQFRGALAFALVWAPVLALVWFGAAQRVERLRGEDLGREGL